MNYLDGINPGMKDLIDDLDRFLENRNSNNVPKSSETEQAKPVVDKNNGRQTSEG